MFASWTFLNERTIKCYIFVVLQSLDTLRTASTPFHSKLNIVMSHLINSKFWFEVHVEDILIKSLIFRGHLIITSTFFSAFLTPLSPPAMGSPHWGRHYWMTHNCYQLIKYGFQYQKTLFSISNFHSFLVSFILKNKWLKSWKFTKD